MTEKRHNHTPGHPFRAVAIAVTAVALLSLLPWSAITGNFVKDFNLLADVLPPDSTAAVQGASAEIVDPELLLAMEEAVNDTVEETLEQVDPEMHLAQADEPTLPTPSEMLARKDGEMIIEDYTPDGSGLKNLKAAVESGRLARIAMIGDSYIEGDIFSKDIRQQLQELYGGNGVGYVPPYSPISGFRRSVSVIGSEAWKSHSLSSGKKPYLNIAGEYYTAAGPANVTYKSYKKSTDQLSSWTQSKVVYIAPAAGKLTLINDTDTLVVDVTPSEEPQAATLSGSTQKFIVKSNVPGMVFIGAWLDGDAGVSLDCMSVRGDSGITHRNISEELARMLRRHIDYDLIIVEYGINALSAGQSDYKSYAKMMAGVIEKLKACYPNADILMLGVGDRGQKIGSEVHSLAPIANMVTSQRWAARTAGCLFWDTREAMGGADAIVDWRERGLVNGDYIHLNSDGGRELASLLVKSLLKELK